MKRRRRRGQKRGEKIGVKLTRDRRFAVLRTGLVSSASGSAYLELAPASQGESKAGTLDSLITPFSNLKLTCAVHGPKPLPRSNTFIPNLHLTAQVKYAPFASRARRGYTRDAGERDLGVHLENALRGVVLGDRWPKYGVEVVVTVLEGEDDRWWMDDNPDAGGTATAWGAMTVLAGCITVASAALVDAEVDCVDLITGGVAALVHEPRSVRRHSKKANQNEQENAIVMDPCFSEHEEINAVCVVGYLSNRDEITELWLNGDCGDRHDELLDNAVEVAAASRSVLGEVLREMMEAKAKASNVED